MHTCVECGQDSGFYGVCGSCFAKNHGQQLVIYAEDAAAQKKFDLVQHRFSEIKREDPCALSLN